jgi:Lrp/AsnC family leucine-responsive transcriptional regulator
MDMTEIRLDTIDRRILDHLQGHARATTLELAAATQLSPAQCNRRHRRLEELGLVTRYETRLDAPRLGLHVVAFVNVTMDVATSVNWAASRRWWVTWRRSRSVTPSPAIPTT